MRTEPTLGTNQFRTEVIQANNSFTDFLTGFTTCDIPGGANIGALCARASSPIGSGTVMIANNQSGELITMQISITANVADSITINSASVTVPATAPTAQDKANIVAALQSRFDGVTPGLLDTVNGAGASNGNGTGIAFTSPEMGFLQSRFDSDNPMDREYGSALAATGYLDGKMSGGNGFGFTLDLARLAGASAGENAALGVAGDPEDGSARAQSRVTSFVKGEYVDFDDGQTNADRNGHLWVVTSGLGYRLDENTTIGLLARFRSGEAASSAADARLDSDFWGGGAYLTSTLGGGLNLSLAGLYEIGNNDIRIGSDTGSFDSRHITLEGRLDKRYNLGEWWIEPGVGVRYIDTDQDNYTDSSGTFVTNKDVTLGRLTYGPKIGTTINSGEAVLKPFARINGIWDFVNEGSFATSTAGTYTSASNGINLGSGIEVTYLSGLTLHLAGDWFGYDTELEVWSLAAGISAPLSAFGLNTAGLVSLDFAANAQDTQAKMKLTIPLGQRKQ